MIAKKKNSAFDQQVFYCKIIMRKWYHIHLLQNNHQEKVTCIYSTKKCHYEMVDSPLFVSSLSQIYRAQKSLKNASYQKFLSTNSSIKNDLQYKKSKAAYCKLICSCNF
jgi:hypothetical protein